MHLLLTGPASLDDASAVARELMDEVAAACDRFRPASELSRVRPGEPTVVSGLLALLVRTALRAAERTGGLCDPTVGHLLQEMGYDRDIELVLDDETPVRVVVRPRAGWRAVRLEGEVLTLPPGIGLDLGATAKALTADLIAQRVAAELGCGVLMNLGGDIATAGQAPDGGWQVRVQDLPGDPAASIALHSGFAVATSSTQRRTWHRGGERLHHIVDPRTGRTASTAWRTVSVVAQDAVQANEETTAAIVAGPGALPRLEGLGLPARLVARDGTVRTLGGWPRDAEAAA